MLRVDIITIFPKIFDNVLSESILKIAQAKRKLKVIAHDLRVYTHDKHLKVDDRPFGGGPGMVMTPQPIFDAVEAIARRSRVKKKDRRVILLSAQGRVFSQAHARRLARFKQLILICGRYEGVDERVVKALADEEISIGDYVLTGGELPAMVLIDSITRLIPGVLGRKESLHDESFNDKLLEYPQYTRPADFRGHRVPDILTSGDHQKIAQWRRREALENTRAKRPDLLLSKDEAGRMKNNTER